MTNDRDHGERITVVWAGGREIGARYPRGRPYAYIVVGDLWAGRRGLGWPNLAVFLTYAGLVVLAAIGWGRPWALIGFGGPWTMSGTCYLPLNVRAVNRRIDALSSRPPVQDRVIAVLTDTSTDEDGYTSTSHTPVIAFTTHEGTTVTAYCADELPDPANAYGRGATIHYTPGDPPCSPSTSRHSTVPTHCCRALDIAFGVVALLLGVAAVVVGAVLL